MERRQALIEEITAAFHGVSREGGVSLTEARVIDDYGTDEECAQARALDTDRTWQEVPDDDITQGYSCLSFLDPIGFRYYIPAYLVWYIKNVRENPLDMPGPSSNTFEFLIYNLMRQDDQFSLLTAQQSKAVAHFLLFAAEIDDAWSRAYDPSNSARQALQQYWGQFL